MRRTSIRWGDEATLLHYSLGHNFLSNLMDVESTIQTQQRPHYFGFFIADCSGLEMKILQPWTSLNHSTELKTYEDSTSARKNEELIFFN